jgi:serine/threonine protein kinase
VASAERKRAGFAIAERLWVGMYGETFRAAGAGRRDLHALIVDPRIGHEPGVASTLLDDAVPALRPVHHRAVVGTVAAVRDAGDLVVITEEAPESVSLHEVLAACRAKGLKVPQEVAAAVGRAIVDAAATAHAAGVVHAAIHPRSILIDGEGQVRLGDFAIGRAVVTAVTRGASPDLLRGLTGYVAPELATDDQEPTPACDVFSIGAILYVMLTGDLPPGSLNTTPAMERLIQRALDPELARRFQTAVELQENLAEALEDDRWYAASQGELARFVGRSRAEDSLDAQTEDLLASLGVGGDPPTRDTIDLDEVSATAIPSAPAPSNASGSLDSVLADLEDGDEPLTEVDGAGSALRRGSESERDPISEMIELDRARTGGEDLEIPEPSKGRSGERARRLGSPRRGAPAPIEDTPPTPNRAAPRVATPSYDLGFDADPGPVPTLKGGRKLTGLIWLIVLLAAGGGLVWVITDLRQKSKQQEARDRKVDEEAAQKAKAAEAMLQDPGSIRISSDPAEAAVWLLLGRTPADSLGLPTNQLAELRVELENYQPAELAVTAKDWTGEGNARQAKFAVTLQPGEPATPTPPMPDRSASVIAELSKGLTEGRGFIHVESTPAGAAVWLLVGKSGAMKLEGIEAGRDYDLSELKEGYTPGYVHITAEDWRDGGDPATPLAAAPKHKLLERVVNLVELPAKKPK